MFVGFNHQPGPNEEALVRGAGGAIKYNYRLVPAIATSLTQEAIQGLLNNPNVAYIEPVIEVRIVDHPTGDAELDNAWGVAHIGSGVIHTGGNKGAGIKVGVLDSGIDTDHPDSSYDPNCSYGTSYGTIEDGNGHGTHTAGTVAALDNGSGVIGVAPGTILCIYKVLSDGGGGSYDDVVAALDRAVLDGVQVSNNSYGSDGDPGTTVKTAFDNAHAAGMLHAAAAGNAGNPPGKGDNCIYPARWDSLIATAATTESDSRASFSSTCPENELAAPGYQVNSTTNDGDYGTKSGTSMASPHIAGTAALVLAANSGWSNDQVRAQLIDTAIDLGSSGRDNKYGYGLVNADEAAAPSGPVNETPNITITSPADGSTFDSGATILFEGTASDTEDGDLTASLAWTSSIDGDIGTGGSFYTTLSDGDHTITASATDGGGKTGSASVSVSVTPPPNDVPVVTITSPADGSTFDSGSSIDFAGTASDTEDGDLTASLAWSSSIDGDIGTGGSFSTTLSDGNHTITASATDSGSATGSASVSITVGTPPAEATTVSVTSIDYATEGGKNKDKHLLITLTLVDDLGGQVAGASVSIDLYRDGSLVASGTGTAGTITFSYKNAAIGYYTTEVTDVTADGLTWDGVTPGNGFDKLTGSGRGNGNSNGLGQ
ncbi:MAG: hypothetical protein BZY88_01145 [SAR202 cluster bacterium Io17-Chloro-G9]|nr:MAG: hypothetical protein BZY88_01145 [SAR202 cluster bacterium Io17-Chloro-G9]